METMMGIKKLLFLSVAVLAFCSCSTSDEPERPAQRPISDTEVDEALARSVQDESTPEDVDFTLQMKKSLKGEWLVMDEGQVLQRVTFGDDMEMHTFSVEAEGDVRVFPAAGQGVAYGRTVMVYNSDQHQESNLYVVCEMLPTLTDFGFIRLRAHGGTQGLEMDKELILVKEGMEADDKYFPERELPDDDLYGTWELASVNRVWDNRNVLAAYLDMLASLGIERPLPTLTFEKNGAVVSSARSEFFCSNAHVTFWGQSFVLYREDQSSAHTDFDIFGVYEVESLDDDEMVIGWYPGNGDSPRRMVLRKAD